MAIGKFNLGDLTGLDDLEQSIEIALAARSPEAARAYNNLGAFVWQLGDNRRAYALLDEASVVGERLGSAAVATYSRVLQIVLLVGAGEWDEGLDRADAFLAACEAGESHYLEGGIRRERA